MPVETVASTVRPYDISPFSFVPDSTAVTKEVSLDNPFKSFFDAAMDAVEETNNYQIIADDYQVALATGQTDDILSVLLAQGKAYDTLNFTVQVTNKIIESYREIMRMQI